MQKDIPITVKMRGQPARSLHTREPLGRNEIGSSDTAALWRNCNIALSDTYQTLTDECSLTVFMKCLQVSNRQRDNRKVLAAGTGKELISVRMHAGSHL